jgi:hypothetical protein
VALGRRAFLQRLALVCGALGLTDASLAGRVAAYQQALAQPANRRLALLVGIDRYPESVWQGGDGAGHGFPLRGCATDVALQKALLVQRFGFAPQDVLTLVDGEATRDRILQAIDDHLIAQVQPGDGVVFHFSGLGGQVHPSDRPQVAIPTLVAVDSHLPQDQSPVIQDLLLGALAERLRQLPTSQITTVLDTSSAEPQTNLQGNFRVRSRPVIPTGDLPPAWATADTRLDTLTQPAWPGLVVRASTRDRVALESDWSGFSAGVFTYALTQQLWTAALGADRAGLFQRVNQTMMRWLGPGRAAQIVEPLPPKSRQRLYGLGRDRQPPVVGVIESLNTNNKTAQIWLGGTLPTVLAQTAMGSRLRPALPPGTASPPSGDLILQSRQGLRATAQLQTLNGLAVGTGLVEAVRLLPRQVALQVALDDGLERIERVDATSALAGIPYVDTALAGEQMADCLFGRVQAGHAPTLTAAAPSPGMALGRSLAAEPDPEPASPSGYGLFAPDHTLIPGTTTGHDEAVKTAVGRLHEHLQGLLAAKLMRLTENAVSSELAVRFTLETAEKVQRVLAQAETARSQSRGGAATVSPSLKTADNGGGRRLRFRLQNRSRQPLYCFLAALDHRGRFSVYCPTLADPPLPDEPLDNLLTAAKLAPDGQRSFPASETGWLMQHPAGTLEVFAILSAAPFRQTWRTLRQQGGILQGDRLVTLTHPLPVAQALLADLDAADRSVADGAAASASSDNSELWRLQVSQWASLTLMA